MLKKLSAGLVLLVAIGLLTSSIGFSYYPPPTLSAFTPTGEATLALTTASSRVALTTTGSSTPLATTAVIANTGSNLAFVLLGTSAVVATTATGYPIPAGQQAALTIGAATYIAGIAGASTSTLYISTGY